MREIEKPRVIKGSAEYRRPTPPAKELSPLRGLKQRWTADAGITFAATRAAAIRERATQDIQTVQRVFV